jgi:3',5'-cyclic AMP phosphodiesterase CpdA
MPDGANGRPFTIVQLSDLHCGQQFFLPNLLERAISEVNDLAPNVVVISGDLTSHGFKDEYALAKRYLEGIECESIVVIPGNHDSRNVGYVHFEDLFGDRNSVLRCDGVTVVAVDSSEPDLDNGQIGRGRYRWIEEQFAAGAGSIGGEAADARRGDRTPSASGADLRVFVLHHHLLPIPGTGRERNIVTDAGDALECLQRAGVDLVLSGHKHVPYAWRLEDLFIVNAGTVSSSRLRGHGRPCYNVVEVDGSHVDVWRRYPFHEQEKIIQFSTETKTYEKYTARIEDEVTSQR